MTGTLQSWVRDLAIGARLALKGGREGLLRTALTALGVGLGVAMLLLAAAVPHMLANRSERSVARETFQVGQELRPGDGTFLLANNDTTYHGTGVRGRLVRPEGPDAPVPPGVDRLPGPGEMVLSPALAGLLRSGEGELLRERLPYRIVGTITDAGLLGPDELTYYAGSDTLQQGPRVQRADQFGVGITPDRTGPVLMLLIVLSCVALLVPLVVLIATAVRFGSERRDQRLAALRLVGADARMTRRIAAGEALSGAVIGLGAGLGIFFLARQFADEVTIRGFSVFASDLAPDARLAVLIALVVPATAVVVTLIALRGITIEPLGVVRNATTGRRRLWWRLPAPVAGLALLLPLSGSVTGTGTELDIARIATGTVLLLVGVTAVLPWALEAFVGCFRGGGRTAWQLAARRLQLNSSSAARAVSGITVAVAGTIAVQMLLAGVQGDFEKPTGQDPARAPMRVTLDTTSQDTARAAAHKFRDTPGVVEAFGIRESSAVHTDGSGRAIAKSR